MSIRGILRGTLVFLVLALTMLAAAWLLGVQRISAPQLITLSALWSLAGYAAALRAGEAGTLHGMLATAVGMALVMVAVGGMDTAGGQPLLQHLAAKPALQYLILAGFWGAVGGMIADIVRVIRLRRVSRRKTSVTQNKR